MLAPPAAQLWLIPPRGVPAVFTRSTSHAALAKRFGAANVLAQMVDTAEGDKAPGTVLFPNDRLKRLEILWWDGHRRSQPFTIRLADSASAWLVAPGFSLGSTMLDLERMNGAPLSLSEFEMDYSGTVLDWHEGKLSHLDRDYPRVIVRLGFDAIDNALSRALNEEAQARKDLSSDLPSLRRINPRVYWIELVFDRLSR